MTWSSLVVLHVFFCSYMYIFNSSRLTFSPLSLSLSLSLSVGFFSQPEVPGVSGIPARHDHPRVELEGQCAVPMATSHVTRVYYLTMLYIYLNVTLQSGTSVASNKTTKVHACVYSLKLASHLY